jgi:DNA-binding transcriptional LysR family regulator
MAGPGLAEINAFVAVAEQRSFAKAALRLGVSVSTLSENLRRLERDMIAVRVSGPVRLVVVGSPAYLERHGKPKTPDDLCGHNCIQIRFARGDLHPWTFTRRGKSFEAAVEGNFIVNNPSLAVKAAQDGLGLLQAHRDYVEPFLVQGQLATVLEDWAPSPFDGFFLYYPSRRYIRLSLRTFIDFLRKEANVNPNPGLSRGAARHVR